MSCYYCNAVLYVKKRKFMKSMIAPMIKAEELRQQLEDLTGEIYMELPHKYCPICGERLQGDTE